MQYIKSRYIQVIPLDETYSLVYHSLYGNLVKVSFSVIELLNHIEMKSLDSLSMNGKKSIEYLIEKGFLVQKGIDERLWIENQLKERPQKLKKGALIGDVQLSVSNQCNMRCKYCFEKKFENVGIRDYGSKMDFSIAKEAMEKVIENAKRNGRKAIKVTFFGGEPLTNKEVIKQILNYFGDGSNYGIFIQYSIDTNGILMDEEMAKLFGKYNVLVNLSIDYVGKGGQYRADGSAGGHFSQFDRSMQLLHKYGVTTYFLTVLSQDTFAKFNTDLLDYAKRYDVKGNDVLLAFDLDFEKEHSVREVVEKIVNYFIYGRKLKIFVGGYWGDMIDQLERNNIRTYEGYKSCPGIGNRLSIEPNGDVFACKSSSKMYGNIKEFEQIFQSKQYQEYGMRVYRNSESCNGCQIEGVCAGACLGTLENKFDNITIMDSFLCQIYKMLIPKILKAKYKDN